MCLPQVKSFQNYKGVATTFYPTLVLDEQVHLQTDHVIMRQFTNFLETKYNLLPIDTPSFQTMVSCEAPKIPEDANTVLDNPITLEEVRETEERETSQITRPRRYMKRIFHKVGI